MPRQCQLARYTSRGKGYDTRNVVRDPSLPRFRKGEEAIVDALLLAHSDFLLAVVQLSTFWMPFDASAFTLEAEAAEEEVVAAEIRSLTRTLTRSRTRTRTRTLTQTRTRTRTRTRTLTITITLTLTLTPTLTLAQGVRGRG